MLSELIKEISAGSGMTSVYHCYKRTGRLAASGEEWLQSNGRASLPLTTAFARLALSIFLAQWILHISYKDHVTNEEVRAKIQQAIGMT